MLNEKFVGSNTVFTIEGKGLWRTLEFGATNPAWQSIANDTQTKFLNEAFRDFEIDPFCPAMQGTGSEVGIYLLTDAGLYYCPDAAATTVTEDDWQPKADLTDYHLSCASHSEQLIALYSKGTTGYGEQVDTLTFDEGSDPSYTIPPPDPNGGTFGHVGSGGRTGNCLLNGVDSVGYRRVDMTIDLGAARTVNRISVWYRVVYDGEPPYAIFCEITGYSGLNHTGEVGYVEGQQATTPDVWTQVTFDNLGWNNVRYVQIFSGDPAYDVNNFRVDDIEIESYGLIDSGKSVVRVIIDANTSSPTIGEAKVFGGTGVSSIGVDISDSDSDPVIHAAGQDGRIYEAIGFDGPFNPITPVGNAINGVQIWERRLGGEQADVANDDLDQLHGLVSYATGTPTVQRTQDDYDTTLDFSPQIGSNFYIAPGPYAYGLSGHNPRQAMFVGCLAGTPTERKVFKVEIQDDGPTVYTPRNGLTNPNFNMLTFGPYRSEDVYACGPIPSSIPSGDLKGIAFSDDGGETFTLKNGDLPVRDYLKVLPVPDVAVHWDSPTNHKRVEECQFGFGTTAITNRPIDLQSGTKLLHETDLAVQTPAGSLAFTRSYLQDEHATFDFMGLGWTHNHVYRLRITGAGTTAEVRLGSGGLLKLTQNGTNHFEANPGSAATLDYNATLQEYTLTAHDKSTYVFEVNPDSLPDNWRLKSRAWPTGENWTYHYLGTNLDYVDDGYGRQLRFSYRSGHTEPDTFKNGQLWRIGDHTASNLAGSNPSGRYVELDYLPERDAGIVVNNPKALLASVRDVRGNNWTYDYYGQESTEGNDSSENQYLNYLTEIRSPSVDTTGDGTPDGSLTLQRLTYDRGTQLAVNGDMELDSDWTAIAGAAPSINQRSSTQKHGGTYSRHIVATQNGQGIEGNEWPLVVGHTYKISLWIYTNDSVHIRVTAAVGGVTLLGSSQSPFWMPISFTITPTTNSSGHRLQFIANSSDAEFYLDDVSILEQTDLMQELGIAGQAPALLTKEFLFQPDGTSYSTERVDGKVTIHHFGSGNGAYLGPQNPLGEQSRRVLIGYGVNNDENLITEPTYDLAGRVISSRDPSGKVMQQVYDKANRRIRTIANYVVQGSSDPTAWLWDTADQRWEDGSGNAINHGTDFDLNLISETNYNAAGQVIATRDVRGTRTGFIYDRLGRRQQVVQAEGSPLTSKAYTAYDKGGRVSRSVRNWQSAAATHNVDPLTWAWNATLQRWEDNGTPVKSVQHGMSNDQNLTMAYMVDKLGRVLSMTNPVGSTTSTIYYKDGRVKSTTDPLEYVTEHRYDGLRRLRRVVQAYLSNGVDPANWIWDVGQSRWEDGSNNAINHTSINDRNIIADVTLDVVGRQTAIRDPRGNQTTYAYDWLNRRTGLTDPLNNTWATAYTDLSGGQSRVVSTLPSPLSHQTEQNFDRLGRVIGVNYLDESPKLTPDVAFTYDISGNRTLMREFDGSTTIRRTEYSYDAARRLSQVGYDNDGSGTVDQAINYEYDRGGLRTQMTLPGNLTITYTYDQRGQLLGLTDWDNQPTRYAYDAAGRLVSMERPNEIRSVYTYDSASRLKQLRHARRDKVLGHFAYTVDARGNRTKAIETLPRPTTSPSAITSSNVAVEYYRGTWSTSGLFKQTTDPMAAMRLMFFGKQVTLTLGVGPDHGICDIYVDHTLWQSIDSYAAATGEDSTIVINLADEGPHLLDIRNRADKNLANTTVPATYKLRFKQLAFASGSRVYDLHLIEYAYDALARLSSAVVYAGANPSATSTIWDTYHYDRAGNRTQQVEMFGSSTTSNYTYDATNRLVSISSPGYQYPTYDNAGRMTNDGTMSYTWDRAGRMLSAGTSSYAYNGLGQRIGQTVGTNMTQYLLDVQRGLYQVLTATTGAAIDRYVHGPTGIQAQKDSGNNWEWIVSDGLGSLRSLVDNAMNVLHMQHYMPYGVPWGYPSPGQTPFGFTGEPIDGNHLLHLRARYYNPTLGVFPSLDSLEGSPLQPMSLNRYAYVQGNPVNDAVGELMGLNRYSYANNNPVNLTDPSGMIAERPPNTCSAWQSGGGLQTTDCVQTCMNSPEMVERQAYPNHVPINAIWQTCYNRCQIPSSYPQTGSCSPCQRKILAVSVANEVGGGGFEMALDVAHIHLNRLEDTRLGKPTIEDLIRGGQVSERLLTGFNGDCASDPTFGERVYNFYADPSSPLGLVGDVPKNIGVAEQAVNYACAAPQSDRTGGSLWFLVSNDASYISNQIDPSGQLK